MSPPRYEVNRLVSEELSYELAIRGITNVGTVEVMRKTLRNLLKLESEGTPISYPAYPFEFEVDSTALRELITVINDLIQNFDGSSESSYKKIFSKYAFALGRVNRCTPLNEEQNAIKSNLLVDIINLKSDLDNKVKLHERSVANQTQGVLDIDLLAITENDNLSSDDDSITPDLESTRVNRSSRFKPVPVSQWNLKFSGKVNDLSLSAFLERVEEMRISRHVTEEDLFLSANDLFTDDALIWYRGIRRKARDWSSLVCLLREQFQPRNYNDHLFKEIKKRTQHPNELMGIYIAYMTNLFERLTVRLPEATRLKILLENMAPFYKIGLGLKIKEIKDTDMLLELSRDLEVNRTAIEEYVPPPPRSRVTLERDLAYVYAAGSSSSSPDVTEVNARRPSMPVKCFNCNVNGHIARNCDQPPRRRCFKCNKPNVTVRTCPACNNSGNGSTRR